MSFGELTITLNDVYSLLGIPMTRTPIQVSSTWLSSKEVEKLVTDTLGVTVAEAQTKLDKARGQTVRMK